MTSHRLPTDILNSTRYLWKWILVISCPVLLFFLLTHRNIQRHPLYPLDSGRSVDDACLSVFKLSGAAYFWEKDRPPETCQIPSFSRQAALRCLSSAAERRGGQPNRIVFLGDSRTRILASELDAQLGLTSFGTELSRIVAGVPNATQLMRNASAICTEAPRITHLQTGLPVTIACSTHTFSQTLHSNFYWRHRLDHTFLELVRNLTEGCRKTRGGVCPDLVVISVGLWYVKPYYIVEHHVQRQDRVLWLRKELQEMETPLRQLARFTKVVFRLNGPEMKESSGKKSIVNDIILTTNAEILSFASKIDGVAVWSASLADTLRFFHTACLPLALRRRMELFHARNQCLDENHVGVTVRRDLLSALVTFLCRDTGTRQAPHCCGVT